MENETAFASLVETGRRLARRELSSVELTDALLARIERLDPELKSYATVMAESARSEAERADEELTQGRARGPLHGVPIAVKDLYDTNGVVTACGMPMLRQRVPDADSTVVARLREAGAVLVGKLQMTEAAFALHHPDIAPPVNPWTPERWSGASSSGSGVAVASGLAFGALGSDTGGSIRFPALCNAIVGIKPTWGRVSRRGVFPLSETLDHVGPMTRTVEDAAAMLAAIAGRDEADPSSSSAPVPDYLGHISDGIEEVVIGFDERLCTDGVHSEVRSAIDNALHILKRKGARVKRVQAPPGTSVREAWDSICKAEAALAHAATYPSRAAEYSDLLASFLDAGAQVSGAEYAGATIVRREYSGALAALFEDIDLLISPVIPDPIPTLAEYTEIVTGADAVARLCTYTAPQDMPGNPAISLPAGWDANGAPLGFQLVARHMEEELLFRAGYAYQEVASWRDRYPPLAA